jgi:hypothetical protein
MAQRVIAGPLFQESWLELDAEIVQAEEAWRREQLSDDVKRKDSEHRSHTSEL